MRAEPKPLILIVEDEEELANLMAAHLDQAGMQTQVYNRAAHAVRFLKRNFANLLLLDLNLPDSSGFALLEELKSNDIHLPIIFVTGTASEVTKVQAFASGGDDYIVKPFSYPEMVARIRAVLRRAESRADANITKNARINDEPFEFCGAQIHPPRLELTFPNGTKHKLGRKELGILAYLNANQSVVITRKQLIHSVWGIHADVRSRSLDQYVVKIRELFQENGIDLAAFRTVHGVGYIYDPSSMSRVG